jgi:hypothetical protein
VKAWPSINHSILSEFDILISSPDNFRHLKKINNNIMQINAPLPYLISFYVPFNVHLRLELLEMAVPCSPYFTYLFFIISTKWKRTIMDKRVVKKYKPQRNCFLKVNPC